MSNDRTKQESEGWSEMRSHDEFLELCAISTSGSLRDEERKKLDHHLAGCLACRQALNEFETVTDIGVPLLSSALAATHSDLSNIALNKISSEHLVTDVRISDATRELRTAGSNGGHRNSSGRAYLNWTYVWISLAAGVLLTVSLGVYSYEVGKRQSAVTVRVTPTLTDTRVDALEREISDAGREDALLRAQLVERDKLIAGLQRELEQQSTILSEMKSAQSVLGKSLQSDQEQKQVASQDRASLTWQLESAQASLKTLQSELDSVRQEKSQEQLRAASFQEQVKEFSAQLREREGTINKQEELLAHDRDIRELMGARDLYIAEVYDVERDGATQKPYGRVFYTKGKSLVFYAYDLNQELGVHSASTFQAWGRRGPDKTQSVSLGVFYEDNIAKKRWVLKSDDSRTLEQIDAVFVTVEPNGGSHKPSGKPLLFTYLKVDANHP
jgi:hypothetical protein